MTEGTRVSIVLPTWNRARFLPEAFASIAAQTHLDWELIVVDDGSTDDTGEIIKKWRGAYGQSIRCLHQENRGAYAARNTGLDAAQGDFVAFFDSDDCWWPHHLERCVAGLQAHPEIDWVYGACRVVRYSTNEVLEPSTFQVRGRPRPFLALHAKVADGLHLIDDPTACACMLEFGLFCGLQNSVFRRNVFANERFHVAYPNEAEDQLFVVRVLKNGHRLAYFDDVHVDYHIHEENSSGAAEHQPAERKLRLYEASMRGYEDLMRDLPLDARETRVLKRRLSRELFWIMGYSLCWSQGNRARALEFYRKGLRYWPWDPWYWKTYLLARLRA